MRLLRRFIRAAIKEATEEKGTEDLLTEPDENKDRDAAATDEFSGAADVAGYTLPLGASNSPTTLQQRGDIAGSAFGGAKPAKNKKRKRRRSGA
jgi:hypothetical protein